MLPKVLILILLVTSNNAFANSDQKPDEFAHQHWSANSPPIPSAEAPAESKIELPVTSPAAAAIKSSAEFPPVALCRIINKPKPGKRQSRMVRQFLISDSDGVDACAQFGGEIVAGRDQDRSLKNVKQLSH